jgi:hypothetical protein
MTLKITTVVPTVILYELSCMLSAYLKLGHLLLISTTKAILARLFITIGPVRAHVIAMHAVMFYPCGGHVDYTWPYILNRCVQYDRRKPNGC